MAHLIRRAAAVAALGLVLVGTGCTPSDEPSPTPTQACGGEDGPPCFDLGNESNLYCHVIQVRDLLRDGRIELGDLPGWVEEEDRDGIPVVYDFRGEPPGTRSAASYLADLLASVRATGADFDGPALTACSRNLTQEQVRRSEGGWPER